MAEEQKSPGTDGQRSSSARSIAYPFIPLEEALDKVRQFWDSERRNAAPITVAAKHWGYGEKSSGGRQTVSAMLQYGLMTDEGASESRAVKLSERGIDLVILPADDPKRLSLLQAAARSPRIYAELLSKWPELPSDSTIKYFMLKEKNFNPNYVDGFIKDFRQTISFAKISGSAMMPADSLDIPPPPPPPPPTVKVGDAIQWTSGGVDQFPTPRRVTNITDDGAFVYVQGSATGIPIAELTIMNEVKTGFAQGGQPPSPNVPPHVARTLSTKQDVFSLDEGQVVLQWPDAMSKDSYEDFKAWIELQIRKIGRSVQ